MGIAASDSNGGASISENARPVDGNRLFGRRPDQIVRRLETSGAFMHRGVLVAALLATTFDEATFGPVHRRTANADAQGDVLIAHTRVGSHQICARFALRAACLPPLSSPLSSSRSAWLRSTR